MQVSVKCIFRKRIKTVPHDHTEVKIVFSLWVVTLLLIGCYVARVLPTLYRFDLCLTVHHQCRYSNIENPTRCNNKNLLVSKISSTCFGHSFTHLQERKTDSYSIWYSVLLW